MDYIQLIELFVGYGSQLVGYLTKKKAPKEVIDSLNAALVALEAHKNDELTKANFEAQRG